MVRSLSSSLSSILESSSGSLDSTFSSKGFAGLSRRSSTLFDSSLKSGRRESASARLLFAPGIYDRVKLKSAKNDDQRSCQ
jgi:hypothetical protein